MRTGESTVARLERRGLTALDGFLGISAALGGLILLTGFSAPPRAMLDGSPFDSYAIPGLALALLIGGGSLAAAVLLARQSPWGAIISALTGAMLLVFEAVELAVIGFTGLLAFEVALGLLLIGIAAHLVLAQRQ